MGESEDKGRRVGDAESKDRMEYRDKNIEPEDKMESNGRMESKTNKRKRLLSISIVPLLIMLLIAGVLSAISGLTAIKTIIGVLILLWVPFYLMLSRLPISKEEKMLFSFFLGIGFFPSVVYYLGMLIGIRKAIIASFILLLIAGVVIRNIGFRQKAGVHL